MIVEIDKYSGFCFGVTNAINKAEETLKRGEKLYCLGHIVHNSAEEKRLSSLGLVTINDDDFENLKNKKVLIRAHGEPPITYKKALENNIELYDSTCPVVLNLQKKIKEINIKHPNAKIIIYGKKNHAEVNGLVGQTDNKAIVVSEIDDIDQIDINKDIYVFTQTTANENSFNKIISHLKKRAISEKGNADNIRYNNSICPTVSKRVPKLISFVKKHDSIVFVSDFKSSNGRMLFDICKRYNSNSHFITAINEIDVEWFKGKSSVGISGATSTPFWLMNDVKKMIEGI